MFVSFNRQNIITAISDTSFNLKGCITKELPDVSVNERPHLLGKRINGEKKPVDQLRVAVICNWNDACGISTYSQFLIEHLKTKVKEIAIFSEITKNQTRDDEFFVKRCWLRSESMRNCIMEVLDWKPDFVVIQHEFGIFPKAVYFLQMMQMLEVVPYVVAMHSVYEHLDKTIITSAANNIIVHSQQGKECLQRLGNNGNIFVVPHGCHDYKEVTPLWNTFQVPYTLCQFGFGFFYKGVDRAIDAIHHLKSTDPKFRDIVYCYLCSESGSFDSVHSEYYTFLCDKINALNLHDNVIIIRKFNSEETINNYLRTCRIALFPYVTNPQHIVYGVSGAIRIAIANRVPIIASESHMFDDLEGIVPRPDDCLSLAREIDEIVSNDAYRNGIIQRVSEYAANHSWDHAANQYLEVYKAI